MNNSVTNYVSLPYYLHFYIASNKKSQILPILFFLVKELFSHNHSTSLIILNPLKCTNS